MIARGCVPWMRTLSLVLGLCCLAVSGCARSRPVPSVKGVTLPRGKGGVVLQFTGGVPYGVKVHIDGKLAELKTDGKRAHVVADPGMHKLTISRGKTSMEVPVVFKAGAFADPVPVHLPGDTDRVSATTFKGPTGRVLLAFAEKVSTGVDVRIDNRKIEAVEVGPKHREIQAPLGVSELYVREGKRIFQQRLTVEDRDNVIIRFVHLVEDDGSLNRTSTDDNPAKPTSVGYIVFQFQEETVPGKLEVLQSGKKLDLDRTSHFTCQVNLPPGSHEVMLRDGPRQQVRKVDVRPWQWTFVPVTLPGGLAPPPVPSGTVASGNGRLLLEYVEDVPADVEVEIDRKVVKPRLSGKRVQEFETEIGARQVVVRSKGREFKTTASVQQAQGAVITVRLPVAEPPPPQEIASLEGHTGPVHLVRFSPDGRTIVTAGREATESARVWDMRTHLQVATLALERGAKLRSLAFVQDRELLLGGFTSERGTHIGVWDSRKGKLMGKPVLHAGLGAVALFPSGRLFASVGGPPSSDLRLWLPTGQKLRSLLHRDPPTSLAIAPSEQRLATGSEGGLIRVWALNGRVPDRTFSAHTARISDLVFAPSGAQLFSASAGIGGDGSLRGWEADTGRQVWSLTVAQGMDDALRSAAFSSDGGRAACGHADGSVTLWDLRKSKKTATFRPHRGPVLSVALAPDGEHIVSGGEDGQVKIYRHSPAGMSASGGQAP